MAGEAVASPMRLATAPGRSARPAPPGNDDPCEERRTIPEGLPRLPREAFARGLRRAVPKSAEALAKADGRITASTGPGQKSHVERRKGERAHSLGTQDASTAHRMSGLPDMRHVKIGLRGSVCGISNAAAGILRCATNARRASARAVRSMRRLPAGHKRVHARLA
jgi:hypothetical protein